MFDFCLSFVPRDEVIALATVAEALQDHLYENPTELEHEEPRWFSVQWLAPPLSLEDGEAWAIFGSIERGVVMSVNDAFLTVFDADRLYDAIVPTHEIVAMRLWDASGAQQVRRAETHLFDEPSREVGAYGPWPLVELERDLVADPEPLRACDLCRGPMNGERGFYCPDCRVLLVAGVPYDEAQALVRL